MKFLEILTYATFLTGFITLVDYWFLKSKRRRTYQLHGASQKPHWILELSHSLFPVLLFVLIVRSFVAEPFRIPSGSMKPTLLEGDFILVQKFRYGLRLPVTRTKILNTSEPQRGDIVVFHHTVDKDLIKRIVGLPGDKIQYSNDSLYINGEVVKQKFIQDEVDNDISGVSFNVRKNLEFLPGKTHDIYLKFGELHRFYAYNDVTVPAGHYFVMGDNRHNSEDSRVWGFVPEEQIVGYAFMTWLSLDFQNGSLLQPQKLIRWNRIFKSMYEKNTRGD